MANRNIQYDIDVQSVQRLFREMNLNRKEARRAVRLGLAQSGRLIRNQARVNLTRAYVKHGSLDYENMKRFVRSGVFKNLGGVVISIAGNHKKKYAASLARKGVKDLAFTLKFFENGTNYRYNKQKKTSGSLTKPLKTKRYTGLIIASHFFADAVTSKKDDSQKLLQSFIEGHIRRIARKNQSR